MNALRGSLGIGKKILKSAIKAATDFMKLE